MFKFIKEKILRIKPVFKIQIKRSSFSNEYCYIRFSGNNGWTWQTILRAVDTFSFEADYDGQMHAETKYIPYDEVVSFAKQFKTLNDCINYNNKLIEKVKDNNKKAKKDYIKKVNNINNSIKNFNKK